MKIETERERNLFGFALFVKHRPDAWVIGLIVAQWKIWFWFK